MPTFSWFLKIAVATFLAPSAAAIIACRLRYRGRSVSVEAYLNVGPDLTLISSVGATALLYGAKLGDEVLLIFPIGSLAALVASDLIHKRKWREGLMIGLLFESLVVGLTSLVKLPTQ